MAELRSSSSAHGCDAKGAVELLLTMGHFNLPLACIVTVMAGAISARIRRTSSGAAYRDQIIGV